MTSTPKAPRERPLRDAIIELRARHGENSPSYFQFWKACADGRVRSRKKGTALMVSNTLAELERIFGLVTPPEPKVPSRPKRPRSPQPPSAA